jgi:ABC-2 type transport system ATP-binding protein
MAYRDALVERFDLDPSKKVRAYSKGNRQKLILIAGLMTRADLLLLDEPTAGLDPLMERTFRACIDEARERGQTVFLSSHILAEVEALCDRIAILRAGHLAEVGTLEQMRHLSALQVEAELTGPTEELMRVLASAGVRRIVSREPSLEELFLAHYGAEDGEVQHAVA